MNAIDRDDTEKKITEIREALEKIDRGDLFEIAMAHEKSGEWLRFLLDELDKRDEENRKLREERDAVAEGYRQQVELAGELMTKLVSAQQERNMYKSSSEVFYERLKKEVEQQEKLIEGLHNYMKELDRRYQKAYRNYDIDCDHHQLGMAEAFEVAERRLLDILKEIGVTVE